MTKLATDKPPLLYLLEDRDDVVRHAEVNNKSSKQYETKMRKKKNN